MEDSKEVKEEASKNFRIRDGVQLGAASRNKLSKGARGGQGQRIPVGWGKKIQCDGLG